MPAYDDFSIASLSVGQAAGTTAILGERPRNALIITPPADCYLTTRSGATAGIKLFGGVPNSFDKGTVPHNQLFIYGLSSTNTVTILVS